MQKIARLIIVVACAGILAMWIYAFGFAPRESINRIGDDAWKARSEAHCQKAEDERFALQDLSQMDPNDPAALKKKADIVEIATDSLERAINKIAADTPSDDKGKALVPQWIADYRIYIQNRRDFIETLRTATRRPFLAETEVDGIPISEKIGKFARENDMKNCQPPFDVST